MNSSTINSADPTTTSSFSWSENWRWLQETIYPPALPYLGPRINSDYNSKPSVVINDINALELSSGNNFMVTSPLRLQSSQTRDEESNASRTISTSSSPTITSLSTQSCIDLMKIQSLQEQSQLQPPLTWKELIQTNKEFYHFASWTGIIYPVMNTDTSELLDRDSHGTLTAIGVNSPRVLRICQCWVVVFNVLAIVYVLYNIIGDLLPQHDNAFNLFLMSMDTIISIVPVLAMIIGNCIVRGNILHNRKVFDGYSLNKTQIEAAIARGILISWRLLIGFAILLAIFVIAQSINVEAQVGFSDRITAVAVSTTFLDIVVYVFGVGIYGFLVVEQRISFATMQHIQKHAIDGTLTDKMYIRIRMDMKRRDQQSPLNWVFTGTAVSVGLGGGLLCAAILGGNLLQHTTLRLFITYVVFIVSYEIVIILVLLYAILKVNEMSEDLLNKFSMRPIDDILSISGDGETGDQDGVVYDVETARRMDEKRFRRLELYLVMREHKVGTRIWSYRPTKLQLLLQMLSIIGLVSTSILKIIIVGATN